MKRLLLIVTLLLTVALMGCDTTTKTCEEGYRLAPAVGYEYCRLIETTTTTEVITTTDESATTQAAIDELRDEQQLIADMFYDILIVKYSIGNCTYDELQDYAYEYEQIKDSDLGPFYNGTLDEIEWLINMIDDQIKERNAVGREGTPDYYLVIILDSRTSGSGYEYLLEDYYQQGEAGWFYSEELFSVGDYALAIETGNMLEGTHDEEVILCDFS